ncbi:hypothetical protein CA54_16890 [Symmachiella macrocystis]|uniref:Phage capsid family protein n=1 Tax=Symmachiella macrocystis TaxID=2527985 RepID=A0A5C6BL33_9PLAN|nr:hypothetical protein [Symmachiella macrocystis]TWU12863.1 hypothetical protein CA54_16890 [Symmachiella macrocystis]
MADDLMTLAEMIVINDQNLADINVSDLLNRAPLLARLHSVLASNGTVHKYVKETGAPVVGFRSVNDGREHDVSEDTLVTATLEILDATFKVDKSLADIYQKGAEAFLNREALRHLRAAFFAYEKQLLNGTVGGDSGGFVGFANAATMLHKDSAMVVDATGTTANKGSSLWAIRSTADESDVCAVMGEDGNIRIADTEVVEVAGSTGTYPAYYTPISGWAGLQIGSAYSVGRIVNLTAQADKGLTDELIYELLSKFPSDRQPNLLVTSRQSVFQLRDSRTATNATGAPAPIPTEVEGIPLFSSESVGITDAIVAAA